MSTSHPDGLAGHVPDQCLTCTGRCPFCGEPITGHDDALCARKAQTPPAFEGFAGITGARATGPTENRTS